MGSKFYSHSLWVLLLPGIELIKLLAGFDGQISHPERVFVL